MANMMRNKTKAGIDKASRGARKATDKVADAADANEKPSTRAKTKLRSAADRVSDKMKSASKRAGDKAREMKSKAKSRCR